MAAGPRGLRPGPQDNGKCSLFSESLAWLAHLCSFLVVVELEELELASEGHQSPHAPGPKIIVPTLSIWNLLGGPAVVYSSYMPCIFHVNVGPPYILVHGIYYVYAKFSIKILFCMYFMEFQVQCSKPMPWLRAIKCRTQNFST
jgi:hypothetical protein